MKVLILCTGNSCRSQMAEGFLRSFDPELEVYSAGTYPAPRISSKAVRVMKERGIDISGQYPKDVDQFTAQSFDYVITVCDSSRESCPVFSGKVGRILHIGFEDPAAASGTEDEVLQIYREVRDQIETKFRHLIKSQFKK